MTRHKVTENIYLDEVIHPDIYSQRGQKSIQLIDIRIVLAAQLLRDTIGKPIHINNWWHGGKFQNRGLRPFNSTVGARWSQHKYGRGLDFHIEGMTPSQIQAVILQHEEMFITKQWITVMEDVRDTPSWVHIDCRYTGEDQIVIVRG